jgi:hypothetical protein
MISTSSGEERFLADNAIDLDQWYKPYPMQSRFHASPKKYRLLGGAAGPGKTLALIMDHMQSCVEFSDPEEAKQVHTLLLRRTFPKLQATVITRFREKIPKELYLHYNEQKSVVTWKNGATTNFGSMQHEHNAWDWQGQWYKIDYDEICEFTFLQWMATSAWNRCPVSQYATKGGAGNPFGIGAGWTKSIFIDKKPCDEMDDNQRKQYNANDYEYFPCTYLDNPVYANDPEFLKNLEQYPAALRDALKYGKWGVVGGYFSGAWDEAENVYDPSEFVMKPWYPRWMSGDWGFEHNATTYWHCIDDLGVIRTYREYVTNHQPPETLAESIVKQSYDEDGTLPRFQSFFYSHDAFQKKTDANTIAVRMNKVLSDSGLPPVESTGTDKVGREQLMYQLMVKRIKSGEYYDDEKAQSVPVLQAAWQIANNCQRLINVIPLAPRDEEKVEQIAKFVGDDPLDGSGHGLYGFTRGLAKKPISVIIQEALAAAPNFSQAHITHMKLQDRFKKLNEPIKRGTRR